MTNLKPLEGKALKVLAVAFCPIDDLAVVEGMPLETLLCERTSVKHLSPLAGSTTLRILHCPVTDVNPLAPVGKARLERIFCDFVPERDYDLLDGIETLERINETPKGKFPAEHPK